MSDTRHPEKGPDPMTLGQGDLRLLESEAAQRLLSARIPARFAYLATDGTPRVLATWFHWTGEVLAMPTLPSGTARPPRTRASPGAPREPERRRDDRHGDLPARGAHDARARRDQRGRGGPR
jgi:hypothetical protein